MTSFHEGHTIIGGISDCSNWVKIVCWVEIVLWSGKITKLMYTRRPHCTLKLRIFAQEQSFDVFTINACIPASTTTITTCTGCSEPNEAIRRSYRIDLSTLIREHTHRNTHKGIQSERRQRRKWWCKGIIKRHNYMNKTYRLSIFFCYSCVFFFNRFVSFKVLSKYTTVYFLYFC